MPRKLTIALVFVACLLVFLVVLMPAAVLVERVPQLRPGGAPLTLETSRGRWWSGQVDWRWQQQQGTLGWTLDFHGLTPGVELSLRTTAGQDVRLAGWVGGSDAQNWQLDQVRLSLPVELIADRIPQGGADGRADATVMGLAIQEGQVTDARATVQYGGGTVTWGRSASAVVPVLQGRLSMEGETPVLEVNDPEGQRLMSARLSEGRFQLEVLRAWPMLLGVSQGGQPDDVVFQMSQPFSLGQAGTQ